MFGMPRPKRLIPEYKKASKGNLARVWFNGGYIYLGVFKSPESLEQYRQFLESIEDSQKSAIPVHSVTRETYIVAGLIADYFTFCKGECEEGRVSRDHLRKIKGVCGLLLTRIGEVPVTKFGPKLAEEIRRYWVSRKIAAATIKNYFSIIRLMFEWGVSQERVPVTVVAALKTLRPIRASPEGAKDANDREPAPRNDIRKTLKYLSNNLRAAVKILYLTGARPGELLKIKASDIDREQSPWVYRVKKHKTAGKGKFRTIFFGPACQKIITPLIDDAHPDRFLFSSEVTELDKQKQRRLSGKKLNWYDKSKSKIKTRVLQPHYTPAGFRRAIIRKCKKHSISVWTPYQLRHNAATRIKKLIDIVAAKAVLGHQSLVMTQNYLSQEEREDQPLHRDVAAKWG